jgi:hypothetical protein
MRGPHLDAARPAYIKPLDLDARDICSASLSGRAEG